MSVIDRRTGGRTDILANAALCYVSSINRGIELRIVTLTFRPLVQMTNPSSVDVAVIILLCQHPRPTHMLTQPPYQHSKGS